MLTFRFVSVKHIRLSRVLQSKEALQWIVDPSALMLAGEFEFRPKNTAVYALIGKTISGQIHSTMFSAVSLNGYTKIQLRRVQTANTNCCQVLRTSDQGTPKAKAS